MTLHPTALLDAVASDWLPTRQDDRAHIEAAIAACAAEHDGLVHVAWVREHLSRDVAPHMLGAVMHAWAKTSGARHVDWAPNGDTRSGNGAKPSKVWRIREQVAA